MHIGRGEWLAPTLLAVTSERRIKYYSGATNLSAIRNIRQDRTAKHALGNKDIT